ncbi:MAG: hypothetical protein IKL24_06645, partial [Clostridia bacterium]|nr:hypothetical protein [Clostridia bacterium]
PPSEAQGEKGDNPAKGTESTTDAPDTTDLETTGDSGTVKDEETTLPEETDGSSEETENESTTEPEDADTEAPQETEPVDEKYLEAIEALTVLDEDTKNEIHKALGVGKLIWLDYEKIVSDRDYVAQTCCYGEYNNCVVFFDMNQLTVETTITIAGYEFFYPSGFNLFAFNNGTLYSLEEAYNNGLISDEDLEAIANNHRILSPYI